MVGRQASRKGGKKGPEEEEAQAKELRAKIGGEWRLIFTTGDKGTQARVGRINYWPGKAVQKFSATTPAYSNNIYLVGTYLPCVGWPFNLTRESRDQSIISHTNTRRLYPPTV